MSGIKVYLGHNGWIYEVWYEGRCVVVGCCTTEEAAYRACAC
jgi:hypothetical protein